MSVLPFHYENPFDYILISIAGFVAPFFHSTGHTANAITFEGAIASAYSLYLLDAYRLSEFSFYYALGYFFDCLDGHFARRYHMTSKFGEYFEHAKDIITTILYFYVLYKKFELTKSTVSIFLISGLGLMVHLGHQQLYLNSSGAFLDILKPLSTKKKNLKYTRLFGCGTFLVLSVVVPHFLKRKYMF